MSRAIWVLTTLLSHWRRHPMQLATLLIGLICATALWSGVQALNQQARSSYDRAATILGGSRTAMITSRNGAPFTQEAFAQLRREGWPVSPVLEGRVAVNGRNLRLIGIEPVTMPSEARSSTALPRNDLQSLIVPPGQTLAALETLKDINAREGDRPQLANNQPLPPLRIQNDTLPGLLIVDIGQAQQLLGMHGKISRLLVGRESVTMPRDTLAKIGLVYNEPDTETDLERLTDSFHLNLTAFGLLSFLVGLFIVNSAIGLAFEQRKSLLRTLRACGTSARMLHTVMIGELLALAFAAGLVGLVCGYLIAAALLPDVSASLRGLYGAQVAGQLTLKPIWWISGLAISMLGALIAAASSMIKAMRLPLLASAQPFAWQQQQQRNLRWQALAALLAFIAAFVAIRYGDSLISGFAALAALLLGAALALPPILGLVLAGGERASRRALVKWFWADNRLQLSGLSLALMALLLALAVNVGVGTMVQSFSRTFTIWLDGRLSSEIYLQAESDEQARELQAWLAGRADIKAVLPTSRTDTHISGMPVEVVGYIDHATYRDHWPLLDQADNPWGRLQQGETLISEQLARRLKLGIGDMLDVPLASGPWSLKVAAIYADYGNPKGQIAVSNDALLRHMPQLPRTRMTLRVAPDTIPTVIRDIQSRFGLSGRNIADQNSVKAESQRIFSRTFSVTNALNAFTLIVAGIALLTSLLTLGQSRLPQLAPLWAIGITRKRLAMLELLKTLALAFITTLLALPLGLMTAWILLTIVNVKAFGWQLPLFVFPMQLIELLAVAMLAALLAAALPILRLMRQQPADLVKVFANER